MTARNKTLFGDPLCPGSEKSRENYNTTNHSAVKREGEKKKEGRRKFPTSELKPGPSEKYMRVDSFKDVGAPLNEHAN